MRSASVSSAVVGFALVIVVVVSVGGSVDLSSVTVVVVGLAGVMPGLF